MNNNNNYLHFLFLENRYISGIFYTIRVRLRGSNNGGIAI
jgi:hypothetical protein